MPLIPSFATSLVWPSLAVHRADIDMQLQEGVTFHDGQDFSAEDVKWTIEYVKNPDTGSPNASVIELIDTVEVSIRSGAIQFLKTVASPAPNLSTIQIYSHTATPESIAARPNGTGPFIWQEWVPGDHITLVKNPNYWMTGSALPR